MTGAFFVQILHEWTRSCEFHIVLVLDLHASIISTLQTVNMRVHDTSQRSAQSLIRPSRQWNGLSISAECVLLYVYTDIMALLYRGAAAAWLQCIRESIRRRWWSSSRWHLQEDEESPSSSSSYICVCMQRRTGNRRRSDSCRESDGWKRDAKWTPIDI